MCIYIMIIVIASHIMITTTIRLFFFVFLRSGSGVTASCSTRPEELNSETTASCILSYTILSYPILACNSISCHTIIRIIIS